MERGGTKLVSLDPDYEKNRINISKLKLTLICRFSNFKLAVQSRLGRKGWPSSNIQMYYGCA